MAYRNAVRNFETKKLSLAVKLFWRCAESKTRVKQGVSDLKTADGTVTSINLEKAEGLNH